MTPHDKPRCPICKKEMESFTSCGNPGLECAPCDLKIYRLDTESPAEFIARVNDDSREREIWDACMQAQLRSDIQFMTYDDYKREREGRDE